MRLFQCLAFFTGCILIPFEHIYHINLWLAIMNRWIPYSSKVIVVDKTGHKTIWSLRPFCWINPLQNFVPSLMNRTWNVVTTAVPSKKFLTHCATEVPCGKYGSSRTLPSSGYPSILLKFSRVPFLMVVASKREDISWVHCSPLHKKFEGRGTEHYL